MLSRRSFLPRKGAAFDLRVYPGILHIYSAFFTSGASRAHGRPGIERWRSAIASRGGPQDQSSGSSDVLFQRCRSPLLVRHRLSEMLAQRIYGLALGYEDLNDHEQLRSDPLLGLLAGKRELDEPLAGKSTLNRLELTGRSLRYHKISYSTEALDRLLTNLFLESHSAPPVQIVLDLDATDIPLYGHQPSASSTATTTVTATCRCTSSRAISCCVRGSGRPTRTRRQVRSKRSAAS
jgi:hypothetical protein